MTRTSLATIFKLLRRFSSILAFLDYATFVISEIRITRRLASRHFRALNAEQKKDDRVSANVFLFVANDSLNATTNDEYDTYIEETNMKIIWNKTRNAIQKIIQESFRFLKIHYCKSTIFMKSWKLDLLAIPIVFFLAIKIYTNFQTEFCYV